MYILKKIGWILILFSVSLFGTPFTNNGNGTVTDSATGLVWQKCSNGQNNDANCSGTVGTLTWLNAITYCEGLTLGGRSNWRLPNVNELVIIVDYNKATSPTINTAAFPGTSFEDLYWSSSTAAQFTSTAWAVDFFDGYVSKNSKSSLKAVRCVTGP